MTVGKFISRKRGSHRNLPRQFVRDVSQGLTMRGFLRKDKTLGGYLNHPAQDPNSPGLVLAEAVLRAADLLEIPRKELAKIIGVPEGDLSPFRRDEFVLEDGSMPFKRAALLVQVFCSLDDLSDGDEEVACAWMKAKNLDLNGRPIELIVKVKGLVNVADYLAACQSPA